MKVSRNRRKPNHKNKEKENLRATKKNTLKGQLRKVKVTSESEGGGERRSKLIAQVNDDDNCIWDGAEYLISP